VYPTTNHTQKVYQEFVYTKAVPGDIFRPKLLKVVKTGFLQTFSSGWACLVCICFGDLTGCFAAGWVPSVHENSRVYQKTGHSVNLKTLAMSLVNGKKWPEVA
jgi:hypothetical protein